MADFRNQRGTFRELFAEYDGLFQSYPCITLPWSIISDIANQLTNGLPETANLKKAHLSHFKNGSERQWDLAPGADPEKIVVDWYDHWVALSEEEVVRMFWRSASSGNTLEAKKVEKGVWTLVYTPGAVDPLHRGMYYEMYEKYLLRKNIAGENGHSAMLPRQMATE
jgi:hypothetical protein